MEVSSLYYIFLSYLVGSIPFAYIFTKIFGYGDIRKIGSGNIGATNVLRTGKKSLAIIVLFFDIFKGFLPITLLFLFCANQLYVYQIIFIGSFAILGHMFPFWFKFKGGKGVATYIGFILGISTILGITFILFWILFALIKKYSSLASILSLILLPPISFFFSYNLNVFFILLFLSIIIIFKHISNIKRLLNNSESKIKF